MPWVIKIGGSLYNSEYLVKWLNTLGNCNKQNIIIVPGGGPFADQVRLVDQQYGLDQVLAHNMAVLGMQQFGYLMASLCPKLCIAETKEQIHACWNQAKVAIWEPYDMVRRYCKLEKSWDVTSDSLAAWLASFLSVDHLLFVKSSEITLAKPTIAELANQCCIDPALPRLLAEMNISIHFMHKTQVDEFNKLLINC